MPDLISQQLDNYRLLHLLGSGGFADVYLGEHIYLNRHVAVKVLHVHLVQAELAGFLQEAQILACLDHPNIIRVTDFGISGMPFLVMEYLPEGSLRDRHPPGIPVALPTLVSYVKQVAAALQYAHEAKMIHRDVKPANILLRRNGQLALSDFGIATVAHRTSSLQMTKVAGSPAYMAPEQVTGKPRPASDQYALAMMVYEWLCGRPAFQGNPLSVMYQQACAPVPSLREQVPAIAPEVEHVVLKALAKVPEERFESVQAFATALERASQQVEQRHRGISLHQPVIPVPAATLPLPSLAQSSNHVPSPLSVLSSPRSFPKRAMPLVHWQQVQNRQRLLAKVRAFWIAGVLEQSLHGAVLLALGLSEQPEAVARPWELVLHHPDEVRHPLPSGISIAEAYDKLGGELLILGHPGSGKTTLLLELTRDLLDRAEQGELDLLPIVFNLSSWAEKRLPLKDWLIDELSNKYQVPRKLAHSWVEQDQVLPLLDGLDEVAPAARSVCIEAINAYRCDHGLLPMVICCRKDDYFSQNWRVQLQSTIEIQPLSLAQIDTYLDALGKHFDPIRAALHQDKAFQELVSTPLMLNILTLAYQDQSLSVLLGADTHTTRQQRLFETYVQRMLQRRGKQAPYTPEQTTRWLSWLAQRMHQNDQTVFYVERLQSDWLLEPRLQHLYRFLAVRLPCILIGGLIGAWIGGLFVLGRLSQEGSGFLVLSQTTTESCLLGLFLGFLFTRRQKTQRRSIAWGEHLHNGLILGICGMLPEWFVIVLSTLTGYSVLIDWSIEWKFLGLGWLSYAMVGFLSSLLVKRTQRGDESVRDGRWSFGPLWRTLSGISALRNALVCGLVGFMYGFVSMLGYGNPFGADPSGSSQSGAFGYIFAQMLSFCTSFGIVGLLASMFIQRAGTEQIQPTEVITWSWGSLLRSFLKLKHLGYAVLVGLFYGSLYGALGLIFGVGSLAFLRASVLSVIGIVALVSWLLTGLFGGWSGAMLDERKITMPNEGIRRSAFYGLLFGLLSWLTYGGVTWLVRYLAYFTPLTQFILPDTWLNSWFYYGLPGAIAVGLFVGGWACLKHAILRHQLRKAGHIPRNYPRFLDYAAERILLRKVGGGYIFIHRLLLEHFAARDTTLPSQQTREQVKQSEGGGQYSRIIPPAMRLPARK